MPEAFICDPVRTPIGRYGGVLSAVRADDLAAIPIIALLERNERFDPVQVEDLALGCANQAGEDNRNVARMAVLLAGLPVTVPGVTVNRLCGSGMNAVGNIADSIRTGAIELGIAGGVESMSRAPFVMGKQATAFGRDAELHDTTLGWRFVNPRIEEQYGLDSMAETAENVADGFLVSRTDQDAFALRSQQRAEAGVALDPLGGHDPARPLPRQGGARKDLQLAVAGTQVLPALFLLRDIAQQAGQQCDVNTGVVLLLRQRTARLQSLLAAGNAELGVHIPPLAHAQERQELALAQLAQLVLAEGLALLLVVAPEIQPGHEPA